MIVIISCGARKGTEPAEALDLYTGPYFGAMRRWALSVVAPSRIYILSARYGFVPAGVEIAPYEQRLGRPGAISAPRLARQAVELGIAGEARVVGVGGRPYIDLIRSIWPRAEAPFVGGAIGVQMRDLRLSAGRIP